MPVRKWVGWNGAGVIACLMALTLAGCSRSSPEEKLRETIAQMQTAVEAREPRAFVEHVSADFIGTPGELDREGLRNLLRGLLLSQQRIGVTLGPMAVKLYGNDRARLETKAFVTGSGGALDSDSISIVSDWRLEDGEWRCIAATWE